MCLHTCTVKPVLRGHTCDKGQLALEDRWTPKRGSIHMKFSMRGKEKVIFKYRCLLDRGACMDRFNCIFILIIQNTMVQRNN